MKHNEIIDKIEHSFDEHLMWFGNLKKYGDEDEARYEEGNLDALAWVLRMLKEDWQDVTCR